jgi:predicted transcriptional regulator
MVVNKTLFIKNFVWYLSIVKVNGENCAFWSSHNRVGIPDNIATKKFEREHFNEVIILTKQKLNESFLPQKGKEILQLQN